MNSFEAREIFGLTPNQKVNIIAPTHGSCCTCQKCGYDYDSCCCDTNQQIVVCEMLEAIEKENWELRQNHHDVHCNAPRDSYRYSDGCSCGNLKDRDRIKELLADTESYEAMKEGVIIRIGDMANKIELLKRKIEDIEESVSLAIGGIDALNIMTGNKPSYEDTIVIKETLQQISFALEL